MELPVESKFPTVASEFTKLLVKAPTAAKILVLVAFVVVELSAVKFCRVDEPVTRKALAAFTSRRANEEVADAPITT